MKLVVLHLLVSPAVSFIYGLLHRIRDRVSIHDYKSVHVSGCSSCGLRQGPSASQEALLVCIQDSHERHCRDVQTLSQEVHSHKYVEEAVLEVFDDLDSFHSIDVGMDVTASHTHAGEVFLQLLGHPFGEGRDKYPLVELCTHADLLKQIVDLVFCRTHLDRRVEKSGRTNDLLDDKAFRFLELIVGRCRADEYLLTCNRFKLIEFQWPVVGCSRKSESIIDQYGLAGMVSSVHGPYLGESHMALVYERDEIIREIVDQTERPHAFGTSVEVSRIVLDAGAVAHLLYELQVVFHPLLQAFGLEVLSYFIEIFALGHHVVLNLAYGLYASLLCGHEVAGRVDRDLVKLVYECSRKRIDDGYLVDLISEELDAYRVLSVSDAYVDCVSADSDCSSLELDLRAAVEGVHKLVQKPCHAAQLATLDGNCLRMEIGRVSDTIQA